MSDYNGYHQSGYRRWTQPNSNSQHYGGVVNDNTLNVRNRIDNDSRITEEEMQDEPEEYMPRDSNVSYAQTPYLQADQPSRSVSAPDAGQLAPQYSGQPNLFDSPQFQAIVAAQVAQMMAQNQAHATFNSGGLFTPNTGLPQPALQGNEYNGKLHISGRARVLMGDLSDGQTPIPHARVHKYNYATTFARDNDAELVVGNSTATAWHRPSQPQPTYAHGVYTSQPGMHPYGMPPPNQYQQNIYDGR